MPVTRLLLVALLTSAGILGETAEERMHAAGLFLQRGEYSQARAIYADLVRSGAAQNARYFLALTDYLKGDYAAAGTEARACIKQQPESAEAHGLLGASLLQLNRVDEAETALKRSLQLAPDQPQIMKHLGALYLKKELCVSAAGTLSRALQLAPADYEVAFTLALARHRCSDFAGTVAAAQVAATLRPDDAETQFLLAQALIDLQQYDNAEWTLRRALRIESKAATREKLCYALGRLLVTLDRRKEAMSFFEEGTRLNPASGPSLLGKAQLLLDAGELEQARSAAEAAVSADPTRDAGHLLLLKTYVALGMTQKAEAETRWLERANSGRFQSPPRQP